MYFVLYLFCILDVMQQKALDGGALDIIDQYLRQYQNEEGLCNMILVTIASLTDSGENFIIDTFVNYNY